MLNLENSADIVVLYGQLRNKRETYVFSILFFHVFLVKFNIQAETTTVQARFLSEYCSTFFYLPFCQTLFRSARSVKRWHFHR